MKKLLLLIAFATLLFPAGYARDDNSHQSKPKDITRLSRNSNHSNRPNKPAMYYLPCIYGIGYLGFELPDEIQSLQITLGDEMFPVWEGYVNKICPEVDIPPIIGETPITCEDDRGRKYHGILNFKEYKGQSLHL